MTNAELDLADWRRQVAELYAAVRADDDPRAGARPLARDPGRADQHAPAEPRPAGRDHPGHRRALLAL